MSAARLMSRSPSLLLRSDSLRQNRSLIDDRTSEVGAFEVPRDEGHVDQRCSFEVGAAHVASEVDTLDNRTAEVHVPQVDPLQDRVLHPNSSEVCAHQRRALQLHLVELRIHQYGPIQARAAQDRTGEIGAGEVRAFELRAPEELVSQPDAGEVLAGEIGRVVVALEAQQKAELLLVPPSFILGRLPSPLAFQPRLEPYQRTTNDRTADDGGADLT